MSKEKLITIVVTKNNNPLTAKYSIVKLKTLLGLSEDRILRLLERDQVYVNSYDEVCIRNTGTKTYSTSRTILRKLVKQK